MTKEVMVTITGFHMVDEEEDAVEMVHIGEHYLRNGTHYILYDELLEGITVPVKNVIKIKENCLEVQKKGPVTAKLVFEVGKGQSCTYAIPYGSFLLETYTTSVQIQDEEEKLEARAVYELSMNGVHCAQSDIRVTIQSKASFRL